MTGDIEARSDPATGDPLLDLLPLAIRQWKKSDPALAQIARDHPPEGRTLDRAPPFESLATSILYQQVSVAAGRTLHARLRTAVGGTITPEAVVKTGVDALREAGLSKQKAAYIHDLAGKTVDGTVDFQALADASDEDVIRTLTKVKGIGAWTAKMFLLFHLDRPDVLAHDDLGLQIAAAQIYNVPRERAARLLQEKHSVWSPYASVASLLLWNWRRISAAETTR